MATFASNAVDPATAERIWIRDGMARNALQSVREYRSALPIGMISEERQRRIRAPMLELNVSEALVLIAVMGSCSPCPTPSA